MRLNGTQEAIDATDYPLSSEEFISQHGEHTIELANGTETVADVLGRLGPETYTSAEDVTNSLYSAVSHKGIGRRFYSDRDAYALGESGPTPESF
ncbi:DUF5789 family protein [Salinigranum halophilum]|jgi:hypothetical protein|uniref:DUF5789 family protein n=1 Tax=Salinigranum halophilum TaxID=2565931 RepID=UPI0010A920F4|nr:DUF2795 domain-containing protein [Salinigranum halophilum]